MSLVAIKPPRLTPTKLGNGNRRVYTLHSNQNDVFAWRIDNERVKTATVVFRNQYDAALMAHMIERHVKQEKIWPSVLMPDNTFRLFGGAVDPMYQCNLIEVRSWNNMDALQIFCVEAFLDMIVLNNLNQSLDKFKLSGEVIKLTVPNDYYVMRLGEIYKIPSFKPEHGLDEE